MQLVGRAGLDRLIGQEPLGVLGVVAAARARTWRPPRCAALSGLPISVTMSRPNASFSASRISAAVSISRRRVGERGAAVPAVRRVGAGSRASSSLAGERREGPERFPRGGVDGGDGHGGNLARAVGGCEAVGRSEDGSEVGTVGRIGRAKSSHLVALSGAKGARLTHVPFAPLRVTGPFGRPFPLVLPTVRPPTVRLMTCPTSASRLQPYARHGTPHPPRRQHRLRRPVPAGRARHGHERPPVRRLPDPPRRLGPRPVRGARGAPGRSSSARLPPSRPTRPSRPLAPSALLGADFAGELQPSASSTAATPPPGRRRSRPTSSRARADSVEAVDHLLAEGFSARRCSSTADPVAACSSPQLQECGGRRRPVGGPPAHRRPGLLAGEQRRRTKVRARNERRR